MTDKQRERALALLADATQGEWYWNPTDLWASVTTRPHGIGFEIATCGGTAGEARANAALIAAAPAMLRSALEALAAAETRATAAERELAAAQRSARALADAYRHDKKPNPTAISYALSCPEET